MLATGLSGLTQIQEHPRGAVDALARRERCADQAKQPGIFLGPVRDRLREPLVVALRATPSTRHIACTLYLSRLALMNSYVERTRPALASWTSASPSVTRMLALSTKSWELQVCYLTTLYSGACANTARYRFFLPPFTFAALSEVTPAALAAAHRACIDFRILSRASLDINQHLRPGFEVAAVTALVVAPLVICANNP